MFIDVDLTRYILYFNDYLTKRDSTGFVIMGPVEGTY